MNARREVIDWDHEQPEVILRKLRDNIELKLSARPDMIATPEGAKLSQQIANINRMLGEME